MPRISVPGFSARLSVPPGLTSTGRRQLTPDDVVDAARLHGRLAALAAALHDLPREAKRFARWRMRLDAEVAQPKRGAGGVTETRSARASRVRRVWPLKPGRSPGPSRLLSESRRADGEIHEILRNADFLALRALDVPDTS